MAAEPTFRHGVPILAAGERRSRRAALTKRAPQSPIEGDAALGSSDVGWTKTDVVTRFLWRSAAYNQVCEAKEGLSGYPLCVPEWELLKIKELANLLQLNQQTVRNMVNRGELEYVQSGRTEVHT